MARARNAADASILEMALVGYQIQIEKIESKIQELQSLLKGKRTASPSSVIGTVKPPAKRFLSEAARDRIAAAQRKRWAEHRRLKAKAEKAS
jgi:hypothetical protein